MGTFYSRYKTEEQIFEERNDTMYIIPCGIFEQPFVPLFVKKKFPMVYQQYFQLTMGQNGNMLDFVTLDNPEIAFCLVLVLVIDSEDNHFYFNKFFSTLEKLLKVKQPTNVYFHANWLKDIANFNIELFEYECLDFMRKYKTKSDIKFYFVYEPESNSQEK